MVARVLDAHFVRMDGTTGELTVLMHLGDSGGFDFAFIDDRFQDGKSAA